jgi:hypothetical protein
MGFPCPSEPPRNFVAGIWFPATATPFRRPRGIPKIRCPAPERRKLPWTWDPLQGTPKQSRRSPARLRRPSWGFAPLQRLQREGPQFPRFQPRYVPPPGFFTLLTASSLRAFRPRGSVPLMGFTLQSLSPPQSLLPFGVRALMLFLATRPPALRTRRLRCPAAPGHCSLRGSVPDRAEAGPGRCSLGLPRLSRAFPGRRGCGFPPPSLLRFHPVALGESGGTALQGLAERPSRPNPRGRDQLS